jgi:hypothetical protein
MPARTIRPSSVEQGHSRHTDHRRGYRRPAFYNIKSLDFGSGIAAGSLTNRTTASVLIACAAYERGSGYAALIAEVAWDNPRMLTYTGYIRASTNISFKRRQSVPGNCW